MFNFMHRMAREDNDYTFTIIATMMVKNLDDDNLFDVMLMVSGSYLPFASGVAGGDIARLISSREGPWRSKL